MRRIVFVALAACSASAQPKPIANDTTEAQMPAAVDAAPVKDGACVLYSSFSDAFPVPRTKCAENTIESECNDVTGPSNDAPSKIWIHYPGHRCDSRAIRSGLSEEYMLTGEDPR